MTSIVHSEFSKRHRGVERAEAAVRAVRGVRLRFDSARGLAAMLLAAIVSALLVVADQMIETWAEGQLLVAWMALWALGFAAIALLAGTVRRFSAKVVAELDAWAARLAQKRADERLWSIALKDARVMSDLQAAMARAEEPTDIPSAVVARVRTQSLRESDALRSTPYPYV